MGSIKTAAEDSMKKISKAYKGGLKDFPSTARDTVSDKANLRNFQTEVILPLENKRTMMVIADSILDNHSVVSMKT